ncbi:hypothetical protein [Planctobacterium marinum]|uniref:Solute-binding protein family 3/N-terminal domain-containing protein n=1 Tax=Planctobacterium marinum TaxID=1631968 RepID=A0AA48HJZ4_9ALTE|nr:hypothetical protein MACH26_04930 [Planctobacterium marinum]
MGWVYLHIIKLLVICAVWAGANAQAETSTNITTLRMCYEEQELTPFYTGTGLKPPAENPGVMIEMLQLLDAAMPQVRIEFERVPWQRCLNQLAKNTSELVIAGYQDERTKIGVYPMKNGLPDATRAIAATRYCLFTHRDSLLTWDGAQFNMHPAKPVAVPQGYTVVSVLEKHDIPFVKTNSSKSALNLLQKSLAEGAVTHCQSGGYFLYQNKEQPLNFIAHSPPLVNQYGYLLFSQDFWQQQQQLVSQIWDQAAVIKGQHFSRLLEKYDQLAYQN